jgi:hypothetical protein
MKDDGSCRAGRTDVNPESAATVSLKRGFDRRQRLVERELFPRRRIAAVNVGVVNRDLVLGESELGDAAAQEVKVFPGGRGPVSGGRIGLVTRRRESTLRARDDADLDPRSRPEKFLDIVLLKPACPSGVPGTAGSYKTGIADCHRESAVVPVSCLASQAPD